MDPLDYFKVPIDTKAFSLRQTRASDFDELYLVAKDPCIWEQHPQSDRWKKPVFLDFFQKALKNDLGCFTVLDKAQNRAVGSTRFYCLDAADRAVRLGYTFMDPAYWGTGANQEIKDSLINLAFAVVDRIFFDIGAQNHRSRAAVEKLGAVIAETTEEKVIYVLHKGGVEESLEAKTGA